MFDKNNIPDLYKKMYDLGYLSWHVSDHSKYLSMDDMEWMEHDEADAIIEQNLDFELLNQEFVWWRDDE